MEGEVTWLSVVVFQFVPRIGFANAVRVFSYVWQIKYATTHHEKFNIRNIYPKVTSLTRQMYSILKGCKFVTIAYEMIERSPIAGNGSACFLVPHVLFI